MCPSDTAAPTTFRQPGTRARSVPHCKAARQSFSTPGDTTTGLNRANMPFGYSATNP